MPSPIIQALSPLAIQKIAAGEVIERPANVVKELVENALDAGATQVAVTLEEGGKELARVADDGCGMTREDLERCWLPHTTSKIRDADDLDGVTSFGFRGEALASMAAVSEFTVETRHWEEEVGNRLRVVESRLEELGETARARGTTFSVRDLFRNNPVRRKFLGTAKAETTRVATLLTRLSLAHPGVTFRLREGEREILHLPAGTLRRRAADVLGAHLLDDLVEVDREVGGIHVQGYASEPARFSGRSGQQHFFVNRRHVSSPLLSRALSQAYEALPPGRHPVAALFLTIPPSEIDVNVHPTKREIRFLNEARVFWALSQALRAALRSAIDAPSLDFAPLPPAPSAPPGAPDSDYTRDARTTLPDEGPANPEPGLAFPAFGVEAADSVRPGNPASRETARDAAPVNVALFPETRSAAPAAAEFTGAPCLQIHGSFILVAVRGGYLLVNQRAAHERILYEKALNDLHRPGRFTAQQLLFPELVGFGASESRTVEKHLGELRGLGFDLEPFGQGSFQLRGSPAEVPPDQAQFVLQALAGSLLETGARGGDVPDEVAKRVARAYARAAAVPLNEPLDAARMAALVDGLFATQNPYVTPTGLPVLIRYSLEEIRRRFGLRDDGASE
jgi:DNA mismatch repair protein MutL